MIHETKMAETWFSSCENYLDTFLAFWPNSGRSNLTAASAVFNELRGTLVAGTKGLATMMWHTLW